MYPTYDEEQAIMMREEDRALDIPICIYCTREVYDDIMQHNGDTVHYSCYKQKELEMLLLDEIGEMVSTAKDMVDYYKRHRNSAIESRAAQNRILDFLQAMSRIEALAASPAGPVCDWCGYTIDDETWECVSPDKVMHTSCRITQAAEVRRDAIREGM